MIESRRMINATPVNNPRNVACANNKARVVSVFEGGSFRESWCRLAFKMTIKKTNEFAQPARRSMCLRCVNKRGTHEGNVGELFSSRPYRPLNADIFLFFSFFFFCTRKLQRKNNRFTRYERVDTTDYNFQNKLKTHDNVRT